MMMVDDEKKMVGEMVDNIVDDERMEMVDSTLQHTDHVKIHPKNDNSKSNSKILLKIQTWNGRGRQ